MTPEVHIGVMLPETLVVERCGSDWCSDVAALTTAIARGDEAAFNVFYREYSPRIYRFMVVVSRGDEAVCRDLHQTVMIKAARKLKVFREEAQLWAWLTTVARNEWKDLCRKRARESQRFAADIADATIEVSAPTPESLPVLNEALCSLSVADRELVESFYLDELSQAELARRSGRTVKAVQCALARIRARMKNFIAARR